MTRGMRELFVYTACLHTYRGPYILDITRAKADPLGVVLAPSWTILRPALDARARAKEALKGAHRDPPLGAMHREAAAEIERAMWSEYMPRYLAEMGQSLRRDPASWGKILAREALTLGCACPFTEERHCHRFLAADLLIQCNNARVQRLLGIEPVRIRSGGERR